MRFSRNAEGKGSQLIYITEDTLEKLIEEWLQRKRVDVNPKDGGSRFAISMTWYTEQSLPTGEMWLINHGSSAAALKRLPWEHSSVELTPETFNRPKDRSKQPPGPSTRPLDPAGQTNPSKRPHGSPGETPVKKKQKNRVHGLYPDFIWKDRPIQFLTCPVGDVAWDTRDTFYSGKLTGNGLVIVMSPFRIVCVEVICVALVCSALLTNVIDCTGDSFK